MLLRYIFLSLALAISVYAQAPALADSTLSFFHTTGPLRGSLLRDQPVPIYSPDPQDPWNRIYHLLFTNTIDTEIPRYYQDPSTQPPQPNLPKGQSKEERYKAIGTYYSERFSSELTKVQRLEGGGLPEFFFTNEVKFLVQGSRYQKLINALRQRLKTAHQKKRSPEGHILFQQDLWNRFHALHWWSNRWKDRRAKVRAKRLLNLLGKWIARIALPQEELRAIRPNFNEVARNFPEVLDPALFSKNSPWRELVVLVNSRGTTTHAATAGFRKVFRVFVRIPEEVGGTACLEAYFRHYFETHKDPPELRCIRSGRVLADGSRALLVESLLTLSDKGEIVPVPVIVGVQSRAIRPLDPGKDGRFELEDLPFFVLHSSRKSLSSVDRQHGGLSPLEADAPIPRNGSAIRRYTSPLVPSRHVCQLCHGVNGRSLMTTSVHFIRGLRLLVLPPENTVEQDNVIQALKTRGTYPALKRFFDSG